MSAPDPASANSTRLTTRDWVRGWAAVSAIVAAMIGGVAWLINLAMCSCSTRPPV